MNFRDVLKQNSMLGPVIEQEQHSFIAVETGDFRIRALRSSPRMLVSMDGDFAPQHRGRRDRVSVSRERAASFTNQVWMTCRPSPATWRRKSQSRRLHVSVPTYDKKTS